MFRSRAYGLHNLNLTSSSSLAIPRNKLATPSNTRANFFQVPYLTARKFLNNALAHVPFSAHPSQHVKDKNTPKPVDANTQHTISCRAQKCQRLPILYFGSPCCPCCVAPPRPSRTVALNVHKPNPNDYTSTWCDVGISLPQKNQTPKSFIVIAVAESY
jgi:hypothetical protein